MSKGPSPAKAGNEIASTTRSYRKGRYLEVCVVGRSRFTGRFYHQCDAPQRCVRRGLAPLERHQRIGCTVLQLDNSSQVGCAGVPQSMPRASPDAQELHNGHVNRNRSRH